MSALSQTLFVTFLFQISQVDIGKSLLMVLDFFNLTWGKLFVLAPSFISVYQSGGGEEHIGGVHLLCGTSSGTS